MCYGIYFLLPSFKARWSVFTITCKLSYLDSDFALTLGYLNSALNNRALFSLSHPNPFLLMSLFEDTLAWMRTWQILRAHLHGGGGPQEGEAIHLSMQSLMWSVHLSCKHDKVKWMIIWTGGLPNLSGLHHLSGVLHLHVNRPKEKRWTASILFLDLIPSVWILDGTLCWLEC